MTSPTTASPGKRLDQLAISPSGFVFDPVSGATFTANPTGLLILEGVREGCTLEQLTGRLQAHFEVGPADLARDVLEYVRLLRENGLLHASFELA
jgi:hypothetical protein